jgi:predicted dehydrogenase
MNKRRQFLQAAAGFPMIVKASALGLNGATAPSNRVTLATVGVGWMGGEHVKEFLKVKECQYVAVCDLDDHHLTEAKAAVDTAYGDQGCAAYHAFEEVLSRRDIDAVTVATPDHWHGLVATLAARAKKDVYSEKPLAHNFKEGRTMMEAAHQNNVVWQTGSWQRSIENFRHACELVRNGRIGKVKTIEVGLPSGFTDFAKTKDATQVTPPPPYLNYDRWLGPAPVAPYCEARVHKNWRWNLDYGGGQLMDWIGHHVDIAHWGVDFDNTGPVEVDGVGVYPPRDALWNAATKYRVNALYGNGITMVIAGGHKDIRSGTKWIGEEGWVYVDRGKIEASSESLLAWAPGPSDIHLRKSPGHYQEFIDCVKTRERTLTPVEVALRSATPGWLGQIAMQTGRKIQWDPEKMQIKNDPEAEKMLGRDMRSPWRL